ncbi:MAG TPA: alkaline phosphatase family protein, partial [Acetobacteraceae bacterium]|nr:alkaline phosphatase family protein [Acetobacteraceae bacterium]
MIRLELLPLAGAAMLAAVAVLPASAAQQGAVAPASLGSPSPPQDALPTATPIKHVVVIFNENVSFDHYFATYPKAANVKGEPRFVAARG